MSSSSSSTKRKPQVFNIASDIDDEVEKQHQEQLDEIEMQQMHDDARLHQVLGQVRALHNEIRNTPIDDMIMGQYEKKGTKRETKSESEEEEVKPKSKAKATPKKFSRPNPEADNEPERTTKRQRKPKEDDEAKKLPKKTIQKETKQTNKPKHDTEKVEYESYNEWNKTGRAFLVDQIHKRPGIKFSKTDAKRMGKKEMIEKLLREDGKI